ncbi:uncharacterized protein PAC_17648 [Phialocephala subalpina]|uniref:Uncharacterized protein n=1 Tax=Phialocephala subalpina TaxID=576137 RepID=A0A1L7XRY9_9HELO|nr:uncharacterized protein PAC_17648 [Phialocephala subalpina]
MLVPDWSTSIQKTYWTSNVQNTNSPKRMLAPKLVSLGGEGFGSGFGTSRPPKSPMSRSNGPEKVIVSAEFEFIGA